MNEYTYIKSNDEFDAQLEKKIISKYTSNSKIHITKEFRNEKKISQYKIENNIDQIINKLPKGDRLIVAELRILGNSSFKTLKRINSAYLKDISIYSVKENLLFDSKNQALGSMVVALLDIEESLKDRRLETAKSTRQKNKTKLGRKSGGKTKSMFDKHKRKILKLHSQGVTKRRILVEIKKDDQAIENTSPQALGQYIKKIESIKKSVKKNNEYPKRFLDSRVIFSSNSSTKGGTAMTLNFDVQKLYLPNSP